MEYSLCNFFHKKKGALAPVIDIYINDIIKDINIDTNTIFDVTIIALDKAFINSSNKYIFYQLLYLNYYLSRRFYSGSINIKGINTLWSFYNHLRNDFRRSNFSSKIRKTPNL